MSERSTAYKPEILKYLIQNLIIFAALLFSGNVDSPEKFFHCLLGYVILSIFSFQHMLLFGRDGSVRAISIVDFLTHAILGTVLVLMSLLFHVSFGFLCILYLIVRYSYLFWLQKILIINIIFLPIELVLKATAGAILISVPFTQWSLICLFLLALLISLGKTKNYLRFGESYSVRTDRYTPKLVNEMMAVVSSSTIVSYCLYTIDPITIESFGTDKLIFTVPFVLYGIFRYIWLINKVDFEGYVELYLFKDKSMGINFLVWICSVSLILST